MRAVRPEHGFVHRDLKAGKHQCSLVTGEPLRVEAISDLEVDQRIEAAIRFHRSLASVGTDWFYIAPETPRDRQQLTPLPTFYV